MNRLEYSYNELLLDILNNGTNDGKNIISVFGRQIRHKMSEGFPMITTDKLEFNSIVDNLLKIIRYDINIKILIKDKFFICDKKNIFQIYTRKLTWDERISIYEKRGYVKNIDPIDWVPDIAISLMWNQNTCNIPKDLPSNISSYGLLLEIIAKMVNMVPDELITNMGDCHIYTNQVDGIKEQLTREPYPLPKLAHLKTADFYKSLSESLSLFTHLESIDFVLENYQSHPSIKMPLSN